MFVRCVHLTAPADAKTAVFRRVSSSCLPSPLRPQQLTPLLSFCTDSQNQDVLIHLCHQRPNRSSPHSIKSFSSFPHFDVSKLTRRTCLSLLSLMRETITWMPTCRRSSPILPLRKGARSFFPPFNFKQLPFASYLAAHFSFSQQPSLSFLTWSIPVKHF